MANEYGDFKDSGFNADTEWRLGGCVIHLEAGTVAGGGAFTSGGPSILADANHISVGAVSVAVNSSGQIVVTTDGGIAPICWADAEEDETLSAVGVQAGTSWGPTSSVVTLSQNNVALDLTLQASWNIVAGSASNLWVSWGAPTYRGIGLPSKADQALALLADLDARLTAVELALESVQQS